MGVSLLISFFVCGCVVATQAQEHIYWKDYTGDVPSDAIPAGGDGNTFVGKAVAPGYAMLPGTLTRGKKELFYEHSHQGHHTAEDVMILCSQDHKKFEWIATKRGDATHTVTEPDNKKKRLLIPGGSNGKDSLVVGRVMDGTNPIVGKVLIKDNEFQKMYYGEGKQADDYEVLVNVDDIIH